MLRKESDLKTTLKSFIGSTAKTMLKLFRVAYNVPLSVHDEDPFFIRLSGSFERSFTQLQNKIDSHPNRLSKLLYQINTEISQLENNTGNSEAVKSSRNYKDRYRDLDNQVTARQTQLDEIKTKVHELIANKNVTIHEVMDALARGGKSREEISDIIAQTEKKRLQIEKDYEEYLINETPLLTKLESLHFETSHAAKVNGVPLSKPEREQPFTP